MEVLAKSLSKEGRVEVPKHFPTGGVDRRAPPAPPTHYLNHWSDAMIFSHEGLKHLVELYTHVAVQKYEPKTAQLVIRLIARVREHQAELQLLNTQIELLTREVTRLQTEARRRG